MWAIGVILEQAYIAIVVEDRGVLDGLTRGWEVARTHWEPMLVMGVILIFGAAIIGLIIAIPVFMILFPLLFVLGISHGNNMIPLVIGGDLLHRIPAHPAPAEWHPHGVRAERLDIDLPARDRARAESGSRSC